MYKRILIIDDNVDFVEAMYDHVAPLVDITDTAYNVEEAIALIKQNPFTLILLDINLNNRNGAEIVKFILENENPNKDTPIIILSGIISATFVDHYQKRFAGILIKPFPPSELKEKIKEVLANIPTTTTEPEAVKPIDTHDDHPELHYAGPFEMDKLKEEVKEVLGQVKKNSKLKSLLKQVQVDRSADHYMKTHIGMLINISAAICAKMEWNSEKTIEKFVYASYLHDWALAMRPDLARINTFAKLELLKDTLTEDDYKIVLDHPNIAAKQISDINEIPPDVDMMIKQHHEFGNETGFPTKCGYQKITPFSAVFIVAHTLTDYIIDNPKWTVEEFVKTNKSRLHGSHFTKIMRVLPELK